MNKENTIQSILRLANIHHNISTSGMKLPDAPDGIPDYIFWNTCNMLVSDFLDNWMYEKINDSGNRNICGCNATKDGKKRLPDNSNINHPKNILSSGACKVHDLYHVYQAGRMGATLYWNKYWNESNFKYEEYELEEMNMDELKTIYNEMLKFRTDVSLMMKSLPDALKYEYDEWKKRNKQEKREDAMGYNMTLRELLDSDNPSIVRLAKGIKKEFTK